MPSQLPTHRDPHIFGGAALADHVDRPLVDPDTLSVELDHDVKGLLRGHFILVRVKHRVEVVLARAVHLRIAALQVDLPYVGHDVVVHELPEVLVLDLEEVKEERQQCHCVDHIAVAQQDERLHKSVPNVWRKHGGVLGEQPHQLRWELLGLRNGLWWSGGEIID